MPEKKRILFVDDEPKILDGLRRMLRTLRQQWDMEFAPSGTEALKLLEEKTFDIIVSDMRMPGMTGHELLTEVKKLYPRMIRIVLSGQSSQEMILKSVGVTHQFLSKPCDAETLKETVTRASRLRDLLHEESLQKLVTELERLPSLPDLYKEILDELNSPDCSMNKVGKIISKDIGMTAKILQLLNSAFFGLPRHVSTPAEATTLLGLDVIRSLVLSTQVFSEFEQTKIRHFKIERLWKHSLNTGLFAKGIAKAELHDKRIIDETFLAGLLHDIGRLILLANLPDSYDEVIGLVSKEKLPIEEAEKQVFGATHSQVGSYLLGLWGLIDPILEAVYFHHHPSDGPVEKFSALTAVHVANAIDSMAPGIDTGIETNSIVDVEYLERIGVLDRYPEWVRLCSDLLNKGLNDD